MQDKIDVNGDNADPLYRFLKERQPNSGSILGIGGEKGKIEWNYVKFLVGRDGQPMRRFGSQYDPSKFEGDVSAGPLSCLRCLPHSSASSALTLLTDSPCIGTLCDARNA